MSTIDIPNDIIKLMVELSPFLYGKIIATNRYFWNIYNPRMEEFKRRLSKPADKVYYKYSVLPNGAIHGKWEKLDEEGNVIVSSSYNTGRKNGFRF